MIKHIEYFFADWCKPCQRMTPQKELLIKLCEDNDIDLIMNKAPENEEGKAKFREVLLKKELQKIPSVIILTSNNKKIFHDLNETLWQEVFQYLQYELFKTKNMNIDDDDF